MAKRKNDKSLDPQKGKRSRISQSDVPAFSLEQALRVPTAIHENYGSQPTKPLNVAQAMDIAPTSSQFRQLAGAAIAFGLSEGGYNASTISISQLAMQIVAPVEEGMELRAKRQAFLKPRVISEFLTKYDGHSIPRSDIAKNVIVEMGVPRNRAEQVITLITDGAASLGLLSEIKGKTYVNLDAPGKPDDGEENSTESNDVSLEKDLSEDKRESGFQSSQSSSSEIKQKIESDSNKMKRVFITHGKNRRFVEPIKKLLAFGELEPVVSVEMQTVSEPVPDKVMNDMRSCGAAIIHIDHEQKLIDDDANEHIVLNPNVLIEIGAAMALYGRRFILLVREGARLPSNLQGLFQVRYSDEILDSDATIRLLEAIKQLKTTPTILRGD